MFGVNDAMDQPTFADLEYDGKKRKTRREIFLERMDSLIPWGQIEERIRPFYPKAGRGRRPYELSVMLRIHCVQLFSGSLTSRDCLSRLKSTTGMSSDKNESVEGQRHEIRSPFRSRTRYFAASHGCRNGRHKHIADHNRHWRRPQLE